MWLAERDAGPALLLPLVWLRNVPPFHAACSGLPLVPQSRPGVARVVARMLRCRRSERLAATGRATRAIGWLAARSGRRSGLGPRCGSFNGFVRRGSSSLTHNSCVDADVEVVALNMLSAPSPDRKRGVQDAEEGHAHGSAPCMGLWCLSSAHPNLDRSLSTVSEGLLCGPAELFE